MKRRVPPKPGSTADLRRTFGFLIARIEKALDNGDMHEVRNSITFAKLLIRDGRKVNAAALAHQQQLAKDAQILPVISGLSKGADKSLTVPAVVNACADRGIEVDPRTVRRILSIHGISRAAKPGRKPKK